MSRGLSRQQSRILGLAVAVSRLRNGQPIARAPAPHRGYKIPVCVNVWPDVSASLAAHVLGGVALRPQQFHGSDNRQYVFLETTHAALNVRSSISRALTSLRYRELLAYCIRDKIWDEDFWAHDCGYALTVAGLDIGLQHEFNVPELDRRLWLLHDPKAIEDQRPEWCIRAPLCSPRLR